ncbi:MAG: AbrB/MazE/SpoVT family DNA-binding domain-containing protein [Candidatus Latescibacteria bacterium]|nr:AbrB/MazE/SpoVT family DNA-binding domain-containing protein [Candidatus Latescibacterota bacterium]
MDIIIDRFGRIINPKKIREKYNLKPGMKLNIKELCDSIMLNPVYDDLYLIEKEGVLVFTGKAVGNFEDCLNKNRIRKIW